MTKSMPWFERKFQFGQTPEMLAFFLERLAFTAMRMEHKVRGVDDKVLTQQVDGKWSVKQHIGHLAEVDEIANKRIHEMTAGNPELSPAVFEPRKDYNKMPVSEVIEYFRLNRDRNILLYKSLSEEDLKKSSQHPRLKVQMNPVDLALFDAEHDDHHLVKISEILGEG